MNLDDYEGHTEGPWRIAFWDGQWYVDDEDDYTVCRLDGTAQKQDPTAKLIAAAPELLAEVKRLMVLMAVNHAWLTEHHPKVYDEMLMSKMFTTEVWQSHEGRDLE